MSSTETIIPPSLRARDSFIQDLKVFSELSVACLKALSDAVAQSNGIVTVKEAEKIAREFEQDPAKAVSAVALFHFLRQRAAKTGATSTEIFEEITQLLKPEKLVIDKGVETLFELSEVDRSEVLAKDSFSVGSTYLASQIKPALMRADDTAKTVVGGFIFTISYGDHDGTDRSFTFGLTKMDLKMLMKQLDVAEKDLQSMLDR